MKEEWRTIQEEGLHFYQISNLGRVRSLDREVPTHIVNRGRDMIVMAKRKGKVLSVQYDEGRPIVRLRTPEGKRLKRTVPLLVLLHFGPPCPGQLDQYTSGYKDGNTLNNSIDNLEWVPRAYLAAKIGHQGLGVPKEHLSTHKFIIVYVNNIAIKAYRTLRDLIQDFNLNELPGEAASITRCINENRPLYETFLFKELPEEAYNNIKKDIPEMNIKCLWAILSLERKGYSNNDIELNELRKENSKLRKENQSLKEDNIKLQNKQKQEIKKEYKQIKPKVRSSNEKVKEEKKRLVNDRTTNVKETTHQTIKTAETKAKSKLDDIKGPSISELKKIEEDQKREDFKKNLLKVLNNK